MISKWRNSSLEVDMTTIALLRPATQWRVIKQEYQRCIAIYHLNSILQFAFTIIFSSQQVKFSIFLHYVRDFCSIWSPDTFTDLPIGLIVSSSRERLSISRDCNVVHLRTYEKQRVYSCINWRICCLPIFAYPHIVYHQGNFLSRTRIESSKM